MVIFYEPLHDYFYYLQHNSCNLGFTPTENKLMFILILNIFLKFSMLITLAIHTFAIDEVVKSLTDYFICEAAGRSEEETCDSLVNIGPLLGLKALNIITSGLFPLGKFDMHVLFIYLSFPLLLSLSLAYTYLSTGRSTVLRN